MFKLFYFSLKRSVGYVDKFKNATKVFEITQISNDERSQEVCSRSLGEGLPF